ncbi:hypothetical protein PC110_g3823 [Phytophthora cactorum]|uniref:Uncharacterized protein n=1 Tax=Phytophthora cactorum TaxID=29920 RepID=A0A329ST69_9STRA|nr:hypothetical protein PC112_g2790 [Phytophthora cactorum]KAG2952345.1 hypothetical protein PC117_g2877 [Phytophthora cactorum]KAG3140908.1 hypothetical protein C6341_g19918 [Phytophthora cactorum]RAW39960.1 hypothetical protein PC110_g3823 [Phytophthora cactorum]
MAYGCVVRSAVACGLAAVPVYVMYDVVCLVCASSCLLGGFS